MTKPNDQSPLMGINVASDRKHGLSYADLIVDGHKTLESRNGDTLRPYVGKRVAIVRTGSGPAKAIGEVTVGQPMVVNKKKFRSMEDQHHVPEGSVFDITTPTKHLYPMHDPVRYEKEKDVGHGIIARKVINMDKGGKVKVRPTIFDDAASRRNPNLEAAARALMEGELKQKAYAKLVAKEKPVKPYDFIPKPATDEQAMDVLLDRQKQNWRSHENWPAGRRVGLRLDIPAYERHGVWVNSIHDESGGEDKFPTSYGSVSSVRNATFEGSPHKAVRVATGEQTKTPFARIKGELEHIDENQAIKHMQKYLNHPDYRQVGYDPRRHGDFYDRETMQPITHSEHVVQIGPLVLAKNPKYGKPTLYKQGGIAHMAEGGQPNPAEYFSLNDLEEPPSIFDRLMSGVEQGGKYIKENALPAVNSGLDAAFPSRKIARTAFDQGVIKPINNAISSNPFAYFQFSDKNANDSSEAYRAIRNAIKDELGMEREPEQRVYLGGLNKNEFPKPPKYPKHGQPKARGGRVTHAHHLDIEERPL